jgi:hypothetical protein
MLVYSRCQSRFAGENEIMNVEILAIEELINTQPAVESTPEQAEIKPLPVETLGLVGGGSSVVLL